jgi:hypothetical protein
LLKVILHFIHYVAHVGENNHHTGFFWGNLKERDHWEDLSLDGRTLNWVLNRQNMTRFIWLRTETKGRHFEQSNELWVLYSMANSLIS